MRLSYLFLFLFLLVPVTALVLDVAVRDSYLEYYNYTGAVSGQDAFIAKIDADTIREPYDYVLCGFERFINSTFAEVFNSSVNNFTGEIVISSYFVPVNVSYQKMVCSNNRESLIDYTSRIKLREKRSVVFALGERKRLVNVSVDRVPVIMR